MRFEFVIVGSGIAGLSTAYMLAERGYRVALVGLPELVAMVAGSSSGILTYHMPPPFIDWSLRTLNFYEKLGGVVERIPCIWMSSDVEFVRYVKSRIGDNGIRIKFISGETLRDYGIEIPVFDYEVITLGDGFNIRVSRLIEVLASRVNEMGANIIRGWGVINGSTVRVGGESIVGETIIVAAGAWSRDLVGLNNTIIYKCQAVRLEEPKLKYMVIDDTIGYYANIAQDDTVALGDGIKVVVKEPEEALRADKWVIEEVIGRARRRGLISNYKISYVVSAPCIGTSDSYPVVGRVRDNIYVITALDGVGFSIAPAVAEILVDNLTRGSRIPEELKPDREMSGSEPREPID